MGSLIGYNPIPSISLGDMEKILEIDNSENKSKELNIDDVVNDFLINVNEEAKTQTVEQNVQEIGNSQQIELEKQIRIMQEQMAQMNEKHKEEIEAQKQKEQELLKQNQEIERLREEENKAYQNKIYEEKQHQAEIEKQAEMQRQADIKHQAELQRQTEAKHQAELQRQAEENYQAELERQAEMQSQAELQRQDINADLEQKRQKLEKLKQLEELKRSRENKDIGYFNNLDTEALYREVIQYVNNIGLANQVVNREVLDKKFGKVNISKLIIKSYIISIGKGVTFGNI